MRSVFRHMRFVLRNSWNWGSPVTFCVCSLLFAPVGWSQVFVEVGESFEASIVNNDLNMGGYSISALSFSGDPAQIGGFEQAGFDFGLENGMVLGTNHVGYLDPLQALTSLQAQAQFSDTYFINPPPFPAVPADLTNAVESWIAELQPHTQPFPNIPYVSNPAVLSFDMIAMGDSLCLIWCLPAEYNFGRGSQ